MKPKDENSLSREEKNIQKEIRQNAILEKKLENIDAEIIEKSPILEENIIKKELSKEQIKNLENLVEAIQSSGMEEFIEYIRSPWRMLWPNFVAGVARGVGALIGAAVVIAIIGWFLTTLIDLPLIGKKLEPYVTQIQTEITKYTESTNYNDNFQNMEKLMKEIRDELRAQNSRFGN